MADLPNVPIALRAKLEEIDRDSRLAAGFTGKDWLLLLLTGVVFPAALIWWGAQ
ncbi:MAG: hypothetical protein KBF78_00755 [Fuscovulum sp.]|nr:hypothetical protein [Fuscovulum sp.]